MRRLLQRIFDLSRYDSLIEKDRAQLVYIVSSVLFLLAALFMVLAITMPKNVFGDSVVEASVFGPLFAVFFAGIRFPHTKDVTGRATRCVADHNHPPCKKAIADDSDFTVVFARVLDLQGRPGEHDLRVLEIQTSLPKCSLALLGIVGDAHGLL